MKKSRPSKDRTKLYLFIFIIVVILICIIVWKLQHSFDLRVSTFNLSKVVPYRPSLHKGSIYNDYDTIGTSGGKGVYYTKLENVVCDAVPDVSGQKHYYRISLTFESKDKDSAIKIHNAAKELVKDLRDTVSVLKVSTLNQTQAMEYIKTDLNKKINAKFGPTAVSAIYFEDMVSQ